MNKERNKWHIIRLSYHGDILAGYRANSNDCYEK